MFTINLKGCDSRVEDKDLQLLIEDLSLKFFDKPFKHKALFNPRLRTTGGRYLLKSHNIEINKKYLEQLGMEEMIGIIKHELCHYHLHIEGKGYQHKDQDFKMLLKEVDAPRFCSILPDRPKRKKSTRVHIYACSSCNQMYNRKKLINTVKYVCGKCKGKLIKVRTVDIELKP